MQQLLHAKADHLLERSAYASAALGFFCITLGLVAFYGLTEANLQEASVGWPIWILLVALFFVPGALYLWMWRMLPLWRVWTNVLTLVFASLHLMFCVLMLISESNKGAIPWPQVIIWLLLASLLIVQTARATTAINRARAFSPGFSVIATDANVPFQRIE